MIGAWVADLFRSSGFTDAEPACMGRTAVTDGIGFLVVSRRGGRTSIGVLARRAPHWTAGSRADLDAEAGAVLFDDDPADLLAEVSTRVQLGRLLGQLRLT